MKKILLIIILLSFILFTGCAAQKEISSFEECVEAGYPVMESYPRQCRIANGTTFTEDIGFALCENMCGDGECQEIVCMGVGCPCAETSESCPEDCS